MTLWHRIPEPIRWFLRVKVMALCFIVFCFAVMAGAMTALVIFDALLRVGIDVLQ